MNTADITWTRTSDTEWIAGSGYRITKLAPRSYRLSRDGKSIRSPFSSFPKAREYAGRHLMFVQTRPNR